jgi:hypothetical protein
VKIKTNLPLSKAGVRRRVKELRNSDLFMTMSEIGQRLNISRHRVLQILKDEGLPTMHRIRRYLCECPVCGATSVFKFGSKECKKQWQMIPIICTKRGKLFYRNRHQFFINYPHHNDGSFCSKICAGKWFAEHYGFQRYPEHSATAKIKQR